jgi:molecular chaperone GrpE
MADDNGAKAREEKTADDNTADNNTAESNTAADQAPKGPTVEQLDDRWRRAVADLENARKRHVRELDRAAEAERRRVTLAWLPVVDNLELALEHADADADPAIILGVRAVRDQAVALLASLGYQRDDEVGVPFDPTRHEATGVVDDSGAEPGTVVKVVRPGYGRPPDRQLRPAAVLVSAKRE